MKTYLRNLLLPLLVFAIVFALFAPSIRYSLVDLDDYSYITQNRIVLQGLTPDTVRAAFDRSNTTATMYMPLLWLSYMADVTLFHAAHEYPAPFHAHNIALHALSAVLLYFLLRRLRAAPLWAALLALLWALHPLRVESVAWVTERKDTLAAFFGLAATLAWLQAHPLPSSSPSSPSRVRLCLGLFAAALLYALGLLAKPSLVPLPLAWLAFDLWPLRRLPANRAALRALAEKLLFLPFALAASWLAVAQHHTVSGSLSVPWSNRLAVIAPNFLFYLRKTILPRHLYPLVPEQWNFPASTVLLSILICAALAAAIWFYRRSIPSLLTGAVWIILFFLPASGLQPLPMNTVADRFFYLPAIGLSIALAALVPVVPATAAAIPSPRIASRFFRLLPHSILALLLGACAFLSARLLPIWSSTDVLFRHVVSAVPAQPLAVSHLANEAIKASGDFAAAEALLAPALAQNPDAWTLRLIQADCLLHRESPAAAIDFLGRSAMPEDRYSTATLFFYLANYEFFHGDFDAAMRHVERSIDCYAADSTARTPALCLAIGAAFEAGDSEKALAFARQTRMYADASSVTIANLLPLAIFHWSYSYREQAASLLFRILDTYPTDTTLWNNILWALATANWSPVPPEEVLDRTLRMQAGAPFPEHPGILDTLAAAQANAGHFDDALLSIQAALDKAPASDVVFREHLLARQALFKDGKPYREKAFDRLFASIFGSPAQAL